jgi:hypothetical protein
MTPERWHQITEIFNSARERDPWSRKAFLSDACREDEALRRDVEAMLDGLDIAGQSGRTRSSHRSHGPSQDRRPPAHRGFLALASDRTRSLRRSAPVGWARCTARATRASVVMSP